MRRFVALGLLAVISMTACQRQMSRGEVTEIQARDIADVYVAQHYPATRPAISCGQSHTIKAQPG